MVDAAEQLIAHAGISVFFPCVTRAKPRLISAEPLMRICSFLFSQVVANAVAALSEISESHPNSNLLDLNPQNINKLLTALNECTEWGQIFILDCLSNYNPKDDREAQRYGCSALCTGHLGLFGAGHLEASGSVTALKRVCEIRGL